MTIRDLMLHTSGMTYGGGPDALKEAFGRLKPLESTDLKEMTDKLAQIPLAFDPGSDWTYSVSIDVLGRVIEVASGETLDSSSRRPSSSRWTCPTRRSTSHLRSFAIRRQLRPLERRTQGHRCAARSKYRQKVTFFSGGGGLVSTARDYLRFLTMIQTAASSMANGSSVRKRSHS